MTVQELFKSLDKELFVNYYCRYEEDEKSKYLTTDKGKQIIIRLFNQLLEVTPNENKDKCIIFSIPELGNERLYSFLVHEEDLLSNDKPEHYGYELTSMLDILGYEVSEACRYRLDSLQLAASILYEMTFFGYDIEDQKDESQAILETLNEHIEEIENGTLKTISADEVFENLKYEYGYIDDRSEQEKIFEEQCDIISGNSSQELRDLFYDMEKHYILKNKK